MHKVIFASILTASSTLSSAFTPVIPLVQGFKEDPIIVNDNADYFYAQQVCPPQIILVPKTPCARVSMEEIVSEE